MFNVGDLVTIRKGIPLLISSRSIRYIPAGSILIVLRTVQRKIDLLYECLYGNGIVYLFYNEVESI